MVNLHPPLSAFPLVLISLQAFFEVLNLRSKRSDIQYFLRLNLYLILLFVAGAFFSGYQASEFADQTFQVPDAPIESHHLSGRILFFMCIPMCAVGVLSQIAVSAKVTFRALYLILLGLMFGLVVRTGFLGGQLVFSYGAGVRVDQNSGASSSLAAEPPSKIEPSF